MKSPPEPNESTRIKGMEVQSVVIELPLSFRICCEEDLISTIKLETVYDIGANATTNGIRCLQYKERDSPLPEALCARQSREAGSHNQNIVHWHDTVPLALTTGIFVISC